MEIENEEIEILMEQEPYQHSTGGAVNSVNGQTGDVVLTTSDLENTSDYQTGTEVQDAIDTAIAGKQDTLTAGENITIENNVISATGGASYTAGNAITIENNTINADIYPADYFTAGGTVTGTGSSFTLDKTIPATLKSVELYGDTEQQTYSGKNLLNPDVYQSGTDIYYPTVGFTFTNTQSSDVTCSYTDTEININTSIQHGGGAFMSSALSAGTYHFGATVTAGSNNNARVSYSILDASRTVIDQGNYGTTQAGATRNYDWAITVPSTGVYIAVSFATSAAAGGDITVSNPQLEAGTTATSYEKFVGGTASPNPDYPQDIHVVTGTQTVTIGDGVSSEAFTLSLGSIELCKIGDYQDYIYKSGDNWYLHKAVGEVILDGTEANWAIANTGTTHFYYYGGNAVGTLPTNNTTTLMSNYGTPNSIGNANTNQGIMILSSGIVRIRYGTEMSLADWEAKLGATNMVLYYPLETPTDTILGGTLKQQLNALAEAKSYLGITNFIVTASDTNLPITLEVEVYRNSAKGVALREPKVPEVINALDSTDTKNALSANMGRVLNESIGNVQETIYDAYDIRYITGDMEPNWPEEEPDGFRIEIFEPQRIYYTDASAPVKIYYSDTDSIDNFVGYIQNDMIEDNPEDEPPTMTFGFKLTQMNGADNTPEIYVGQSSMNLNDNELTSLSFEQVGAGGGGPTVVQTPGSSQTDVMSQYAVSSMVFADPDTQTKIKIGAHTSTSEGNNGIEIGNYAQATQSGAIAVGGGNAAINAAWAAGLGSIAIGSGSIVGEQRGICFGQGSRVDSQYSITIGSYSKVFSNSNGAIALGCGARVPSNQNGLIEIGVNDPDFSSPTNYGYGNTIYRLIRGLHDGQEAHDAATVAQGNTLATSAPTTSTVGVLGQLYTDTTTMHTYQCTDTTGGVYTWTQRW